MKKTTRKVPAGSKREPPAEPAPPRAADDETERRIDEIAERHRETLERLARN